MAKIKQGECTLCKKMRAVDENWLCGTCAADAFVEGKSDTVAKSPAAMDGSTALPLDETWDSFLAWVADYCGGGGAARRASYSREDMRYAFAAGYAKKRDEQ